MRLRGVSDELRRSLEADLAALPELDPRIRRLNAEEPYRLKATCVRLKLVNTGDQLLDGRPAGPGRSYPSQAELVADLALMHRSLVEHHGALVARGLLERSLRCVAAFGTHLATMDVREHADALHHTLGQLVDRLHELEGSYGDLTPAQRLTVLSAELAGSRPLAPMPARLDNRGERTLGAFTAIAEALDSYGGAVCESYIVSMTRGADDVLTKLLFFENAGLAERIATRWLTPLAALTPKARRRMEETALAYMQQRGNAAAMARALGVHPQTARYRLRGLRELLGDAIEDPDARFEIELALRARLQASA